MDSKTLNNIKNHLEYSFGEIGEDRDYYDFLVSRDDDYEYAVSYMETDERLKGAFIIRIEYDYVNRYIAGSSTVCMDISRFIYDCIQRRLAGAIFELVIYGLHPRYLKSKKAAVEPEPKPEPEPETETYYSLNIEGSNGPCMTKADLLSKLSSEVGAWIDNEMEGPAPNIDSLAIAITRHDMTKAEYDKVNYSE